MRSSSGSPGLTRTARSGSWRPPTGTSRPRSWSQVSSCPCSSSTSSLRRGGVGDHVSQSLRRRLALVAVVATALSFGYGAGWPDVSRLGLTESVALHGTLRIDRYASQTQDRADFAGHAYTDKAPGNSFLALPSFEAMRAVGLV